MPLPTKMKIENSTKKNHLKSSPLKLIWPIGTRLWWNGPCVAPFQNYIRWPPPANQDIFLSFDTTWRIFKYILHELCFWFDTEYCKNKYLHLLQLVQHLYMLFAVWFLPCWILLNTALRPLDLWFGSLVHFKVHYQKSQSKMLWVILCAYLLIGFLQKLITSICPILLIHEHKQNISSYNTLSKITKTTVKKLISSSVKENLKTKVKNEL